ncbi:MAG: sensor histidine kinase [Hydrogenibacillus schlegelii]|uniref:histidine kinase n=1 Tax=Hydrogenibacillus schlegelii TaxID=1484 RepID=A0A947CVJ0_HYDSH|nr:sensor histidine kinase [Hydrogenibacillus schlegelii]
MARRNRRPFSLKWEITLFATLIVLVTLLAASSILTIRAHRMEEERIREQVSIAARTAAALPNAAAWVEAGAVGPLSEAIERIRVGHKVDYLVVYDMARRRLVHPNPARVGERLPQGVDDAAFAEHIYTKKSAGPLGIFIKAYFPIKNERLEQVGVVVAGRRLPSMGEVFWAEVPNLLPAIALSLFLGAVGAFGLALRVKRSLLGLEPQEIARMYSERLAAFDAIHEGVIAIDREERITILNRAARAMLHIEGDVVGRPIRSVIPDTRLPEVLNERRPLLQHQFRLGTKHILSNRVPIELNGEMIGALAVFVDRTDVVALAEMLTGVQAYAEALRALAHEHKNVLHAVAGMIELGRPEEALRYLEGIRTTYDRWLGVTTRLRVPALAGLILGKMARAREAKIDFDLDPDTRLEELPDGIPDGDLVTIVGNLLENSFEAFYAGGPPPRPPRVILYIGDDPAALVIAVRDNGPGIPPEIRPRLFERGTSSKGDPHRGLGLFLVQETVERLGGRIDVESAPEEGTEFVIVLPKAPAAGAVSPHSGRRPADFVGTAAAVGERPGAAGKGAGSVASG